jgi:hypothetical protein
MPSIDESFLKLIEGDYREYKNFIETGTYYGETIYGIEKLFDRLYTIEIKDEFYNLHKKTYRGEKINFILGDSSKELAKLFGEIEGKSIIFLDGHWSALNTGKGDKDCPLYEELESIMSNYKDEGIIIVDDVRLFGSGPNVNEEPCNWEDISIEGVLERVNERMEKHYYLESNLDKRDRMVIHISSIKNN